MLCLFAPSGRVHTWVWVCTSKLFCIFTNTQTKETMILSALLTSFSKLVDGQLLKTVPLHYGFVSDRNFSDVKRTGANASKNDNYKYLGK